MPADTNPQREDEISRQRGYGESAKSDGKRAKAQDTRNAGFARDDVKPDETPQKAIDGAQLVQTLEDEKHPNVPDYVDSDSG